VKSCPKCHTQYTDDSLRFCLQDGTQLFAVPDPEPSTIPINDYSTGYHGENQIRVPIEGNSTEESQITRVSKARPGHEKSKTALVIALVSLLTLSLFGAAGIGAWLYFRDRQGSAADTGTAVNQTPGSNRRPETASPISPTPVASPTTSSDSSISNDSTDTPVLDDADREQIQEDVSRQISEWKSASESGDLDSLMGNYANSLDYYNKRGVSVSSVRKDKERAFTLYDSMQFDLSNINVSTDPSGNTATAAFDKEWVFEGARNSAGKVRSQFQFKKINGKWLITGERDMKVYYTE